MRHKHQKGGQGGGLLNSIHTYLLTFITGWKKGEISMKKGRTKKVCDGGVKCVQICKIERVCDEGSGSIQSWWIIIITPSCVYVITQRTIECRPLSKNEANQKRVSFERKTINKSQQQQKRTRGIEKLRVA